MNILNGKRKDIVSKVIKAEPQTIYEAFLNPEYFVLWLPPKGMSGWLHHFAPIEGGTYKMTLTYEKEAQSAGKTSENTDVYEARFLKLEPPKRIVQLIKFDSEFPDFTGEMKQEWVFESIPEGTEVSIICENIPKGIGKEDHEIGLRSTLENLALFVE